MEYVLADRNSTGMETYWFKRGIQSLKAAFKLAADYPEAKFILEYREDPSTQGVLPTGRSWAIKRSADS